MDHTGSFPCIAYQYISQYTIRGQLSVRITGVIWQFIDLPIIQHNLHNQRVVNNNQVGSNSRLMLLSTLHKFTKNRIL